jgi:phosphoribosylamine--glycine ligase
MAVCDGERYVLLPSAQDYKRAYDGDRGPNTGGMGAHAPADIDDAFEREVGERIVAPVLAAMTRRGAPYRGALYAGLMRTAEGPRVIEFNCRFGDPETEAVLPLVDGSFIALLDGAAAGRIEAAPRRSPGATVSVALVDEAYPAATAGGTIGGLDRIAGRDDVLVFHAGIERAGEEWRLTGGRAAHVVAHASSRAAARDRAYGAIAMLGGHGWRCRADIGADRGAAGLAAGVWEGATGGTRM